MEPFRPSDTKSILAYTGKDTISTEYTSWERRSQSVQRWIYRWLTCTISCQLVFAESFC